MHKLTPEATCNGAYEFIYTPNSGVETKVAIGFNQKGQPVSMVCQHLDINDGTCDYVNILGAEQPEFEYLPCLILAQLCKKKV